MNITGMQVYKLLPQTNCRECGYSGCLPFAMKVASSKESYEKCPHISSESIKVFKSHEHQGIKEMTINIESKHLKIGGEKVLFRHEETFFNPCLFAIKINAEDKEEYIFEKLKKINDFKYERLNESFSVDIILLRDSDKSLKITEMILNNFRFGVIIDELKEENISGYEILNNDDRLILNLTANSYHDESLNKITDKKRKILIKCRFDEVPEKVRFYNSKGFYNLILSLPDESESSEKIRFSENSRISCIKERKEEYSYPLLNQISVSSEGSISYICALIIKYSSLIVLDEFDNDILKLMFILRQNIFSDPRQPLQVQSGLYEIGKVNSDSPVLVTTNFSLTYHLVSSEIESSLIPSYLLVIDTEGTSVLTAYASDKLNYEKVITQYDRYIRDKINNDNIIIPGYVSVMKRDIEKKSDIKVITGPRESSQIPKFMKNLLRP